MLYACTSIQPVNITIQPILLSQRASYLTIVLYTKGTIIKIKIKK